MSLELCGILPGWLEIFEPKLFFRFKWIFPQNSLDFFKTIVTTTGSKPRVDKRWKSNTDRSGVFYLSQISVFYFYGILKKRHFAVICTPRKMFTASRRFLLLIKKKSPLRGDFSHLINPRLYYKTKKIPLGRSKIVHANKPFDRIVASHCSTYNIHVFVDKTLLDIVNGGSTEFRGLQ